MENFDEDENAASDEAKKKLSEYLEECRKMKYTGGTLGQGVVMLSLEQENDLLDRLSFDEFNKYVAIVRDCELKGQHFKKKTHYQAILDMALKDRKLKGGKSN